MSSKTVAACLEAVGSVDLSACATVEEEFKVIKKAYFASILKNHPDKGGDAAVFREVQAAFETLRQIYEKGIGTFASKTVQDQETSYNVHFAEFGDVPTPSWEFYEAQAAEVMPTYRVELAKSGRSRCVKSDTLIEKGEVRIGSIIPDVGSYGRWNSLDHWRVPSRIWLGLSTPDDHDSVAKALSSMNEVLFCGFNELPQEAKDRVVSRVMNKEHWARKTKSRAPPPEVTSAPPPTTSQEGGNTTAMTAAPAGNRFVIPKPGVGTAREGALAGKTCVLTGTFPEVGGGAGLTLGKDRATSMIESFGGRVTSAVSGKTDLLVVGKEPGISKVSKARERGIPMVSLSDLKNEIEGNKALEDVEVMKINTFSSGYRGNTKAKDMDEDEIAFAAGFGPARIADTETKRPNIKAKKTDDEVVKKPAGRKRKPNKKYEEDEDVPSEEPKKKGRKKAATKKPVVPQDEEPVTAIVVTTTSSRSGRVSKPPSRYL